MKLSDFDYNLPSELIAITPSEPRDVAKLLILNKANGEIKHRQFFDIIDYLEPGDLLIANNSKVIPARLIGKKETGGNLEVMLSKLSIGDPLLSRRGVGGEVFEVWECLIKGRVKEGQKIIFSDKLFGIVGAALVGAQNSVKNIIFNLRDAEFMAELEKIGEVPLPPYIIKQRAIVETPGRASLPDDDKTSYQTVYANADKLGSVAAPTAGLHFTPELLTKIKNKGINIEYLTLHVGLGTFLPVKTDNIEEHQIHSEWAELSQKTLEAILETKKNGGKIIAVGTTTARTLEYFTDEIRLSSFVSHNSDLSGWVNIFIYPPYKFKVVDVLITNFHLPKSTLLMLVSALAGKNNIDLAYNQAILHKYKFYSYGDAMFIW